ncbi:aspartic peptidase domain-containing protein [Suillus clintonianus]|uniref:aspartic peptidase domain-containing protein n=1 Tax=Suillus clintonianus TaxID=1904413 RepID=UPI001B85F446|nr:aspartic peptidase domain-containing protein [Suillus clintonianus]KAG2151454.1 aspartic peptidase domain-containing protein [Suillus clintonianus]
MAQRPSLFVLFSYCVMRLSALFFPLGFLATLDVVHGVHLELRGKTGVSRSKFQKRTSLTGLQSTLEDDQNIEYMTNITLNGQPFGVLIDTGSSDLFVTSQVPDAVDEHYQAEVGYASGGAAGEVFSATMEFAGYQIEAQYFIFADSTAGFTQSVDGLIGLGPYTGSVIRSQGGTAAADPPLDRIFRSNDTISNYLAVLLDRSNDPDEPYPGDLTIGEVLTNYEDIHTQPQHPVTSVMVPGNQHWMTLLDENGIIGPDGQPITITTQVTDTSYPKNATVVFDTGFTFPQVPSYVAEALYGNVPGASLTTISGIGEIWALPCDQELNATFLFAGIQFPIHPLDLNFDAGKNQCVGAFQPFSYDDTAGGVVMYDMVLGMAFLRNAYLLIDFGSFVDEAPPGTNAPFIQLLPITNASAASVDFAQVRLGNDSSVDDLTSLASHSSSTSTKSTTTTTTTSSSSSKLPLWVIGVIFGVVISLFILGICVYYCCCRRRSQRVSAPTQAAWVPYGPQSYRPLHDPSPQGAHDMHMPPNANPGYAPEYQSAWDARY